MTLNYINVFVSIHFQKRDKCIEATILLSMKLEKNKIIKQPTNATKRNQKLS